MLLENSSLTGTMQVLVFGVAGKPYEYDAISKALRETWGNDQRLRGQDVHLARQLATDWQYEDEEGQAGIYR
eukprot:12914705-Prorocentrum_lima.AAC.1